MSTFMIFVIVLTLAYVLYYAALITIDLTAKSKSEVAKEEVISAADGQEEEYAPKSVIENAETGGFSFVDNVSQEEPQQEKIEEAEEEKVQEAPTEERVYKPTVPADEQPEDDVQETESATDEEKVPTDTISEETSEEVDAPTEETHDEDEPSEAITDEEELPNLSTVNYEEQKEEESQDNEPFDESKVFDPELSQPKYGVATIVEAKYSDELVYHANEVNEALSSIKVKGNGYENFELAPIIRNKTLADSKNIETEDEVTRY